MPHRRSLALALVLVLASSPTAVASDDPVDLTELSELVDTRMVDALAFPLTRNEKRCIKAYRKVAKILEKPATTRTGSAKLLKKIEAKLRRWLAIGPQEADLPTRDEIDDSTGELRQSLSLAGRLVGDALAPVRPLETTRKVERLVRKLEKLVEKTDVRLARADEAETTKDRLKHQLAASKLLDKAGKLVAKLPEPDPVEPGAHDVIRTSIVTAEDGNGVRQLGAVDICRAAGEPLVPRVLTNGSSDVKDAHAFDTDNALIVTYLQDDAVRCVDAGAPGAEPVEILDLTNGPSSPTLCESPNDGTFLVFGEDERLNYLVLDHLGPGSSESFPLDIDAESVRVLDCRWLDDGTSCIVQSLENSVPPLVRLDVIRLDGESATIEHVAGGSPDGLSCNDASVSPDGRYCGYSVIVPDGPGTRLHVYDFQTGESVEIHDSIIAMGSDPVFSRSDQIACDWLTNDTCIYNGVPGLSATRFSDGLASAESRVIDEQGRFYTSHGSTSTHAFVHDGQDVRMLEIEIALDKLAEAAKPVGNAGLRSPASVTSDELGGIVLTDQAPDGQLNLAFHDSATGELVQIGTLQSDPAETPFTSVSSLQIEIPTSVGGDETIVISFNVSSSDTDVAGVKLTTATGSENGPLAFTPIRTIAPQRESAEYREATLTFAGEARFSPDEVAAMLQVVEADFQTRTSRVRFFTSAADKTAADAEFTEVDTRLFDASQLQIADGFAD